MLIKVCDRCGTECIDDDMLQAPLYRVEKLNIQRYKGVDLCNHCVEELGEWLDSGKNEQQKEGK